MLVLMASSTLALGQTRPEFEVVSIKPAGDQIQQVGVGLHIDGSQVGLSDLSIKDIAGIAYQVKPNQVFGPDWISNQRYNIAAKIPDGGSQNQVREMIQSLLADRFQLVMRLESKEMLLYEISLGKNEPKLTKSTRDCSADTYACHGFSGNPRRLSGMGVDMADLASVLTGYAGRPVLDKTGISGEFDFLLQWNPFYGRQRVTQTTDDTPRPRARNEGPMPDIDSLPDLGTALDQQLGLKLESRKGPVETYVIVSVERPSGN